MTYNKRVRDRMLQIELGQGLRFHFASSGGVRICEFKDSLGKTVHTGTGATEDAAFMAAADTYNPKAAVDDRADLQAANAAMEEQVRALQSQLQAAKAAESSSEAGESPTPDPVVDEEPVKKKKKTRRRRGGDSLSL